MRYIHLTAVLLDDGVALLFFLFDLFRFFLPDDAGFCESVGSAGLKHCVELSEWVAEDMETVLELCEGRTDEVSLDTEHDAVGPAAWEPADAAGHSAGTSGSTVSVSGVCKCLSTDMLANSAVVTSTLVGAWLFVLLDSLPDTHRP